MGTHKTDTGYAGLTSLNANNYRAFVIRRKILQLIAENYAISASLISHTLLLSYATVFRHLKILKEEDLIELYKEGRTLKAKLKVNQKEIQKLYSEYTEYIKLKEKGYMKQNECPSVPKGQYSDRANEGG